MKRIPIVLLLVGVIVSSIRFCIIRKFELSGGYYIKANLISEKCSLYANNNKLVLTHIGEWMGSNQYVYGYGDGKKYKCYLFDKLSNELELFYKVDDFYKELETKNLKYDMSDTKDLIYYKARKAK